MKLRKNIRDNTTTWEVVRARLTLETETGEILANEAEGDRIKIVKASSMKAYEKIKEEKTIVKLQELQSGEYQVWTIDSFYKGNIAEIRAIMQELSIWEKGFLYSIAPYVGYEDCCIKYDNGKELNFNTLSEITGMSTGKLSEVINGLIDKDILYKGKNSRNVQYFVNPWLFCKGNRINKVLQTMFQNYKIRIYGVKWKELKK